MLHERSYRSVPRAVSERAEGSSLNAPVIAARSSYGPVSALGQEMAPGHSCARIVYPSQTHVSEAQNS